MDQLISVSRAEIKLNTPRQSPSITIGDHNEKGFLSTANIDLNKFVKKSKEQVKSQWLNHLQDKPILQLISDAMPEKQFTPVNPVELNCYERLKKMLIVQNNYDGQEDLRKHSKMLDKVAIFQDKINKAESKYKENIKKVPKFNKYIRSHVVSQNVSCHQYPFQSAQKTPLFSKNSSLKKKSRHMEGKSVTFNIEEEKSITMHPSVKELITELKVFWSQKYMNQKKSQKNKLLQQFESKIQAKLKQKIEEIFCSKLKKFHTSEQQNDKLRMQVLEKELLIESLKKEMKIMEDKIILMQMQKQPEKQMVTYSKNVQQFYQSYKNIFGEITLTELSNKLDFMEKTFIEKYAIDQQKNLQSVIQMMRQKDRKEKILQEKLQFYEKQELELKDTINQIRKYQSLDNSYEKHEIHKKITLYKLRCDELQTLQKYIFNKYIEWHQKKSEGENKLITMINNNTIEDYQQMIEAMLEYNKNYGNTHKNIESMTKLLTMIQRIKKVIAPTKCYEKLAPIKVLQEVESILKNQGVKRPRTRKMRTYVHTVKEDQKYLQEKQNIE